MGVFKYVFLTFITVVKIEAWLFGDFTLGIDNTVTPTSFTEIMYTTTTTSSASTKTSEVTDCFSDTTTNYEGKQNTTMSDHTCLRWDSSLIPIDERFRDTDFPMDGSVQQANNYCRDPDNSGDLWCYTTNPEVRTEKCLILKCESTILAEFEDDVWWCRYPTTDCKEDEQLVCKDTEYTTKINGECNQHLCCYKRGCVDVPSSDYAGRWSHSAYNTECLRWDTIRSLSLSGSSFPEGSIADANNYCRDPDNQGLPYCFVRPDTRYYCGIPTCSELASRHKYSHDCYELTLVEQIGLGGDVTEKDLCLKDPDRIFLDSDELRDKYPGCRECSCCQIQKCFMDESHNYKGTWSRTVSGRECRSWRETDYSSFPVFFFVYGSSPRNSENYCRDFFGTGYVYCRPKDLNMGDELCNIKMECPGSALQTTPKHNTWPFTSSSDSPIRTSEVPQETTYEKETTTVTEYITFEKTHVQTVKPTTNRDVPTPSVEQTVKPTSNRDVSTPLVEQTIEPTTKRDVSIPLVEQTVQPTSNRDVSAPSVEQTIKPTSNRDVSAPSVEQTVKPTSNRNVSAPSVEQTVKPTKKRDVSIPLVELKTRSVDQTSVAYESKASSVDQPVGTHESTTHSVDQSSDVYERKTPSVDQPLEASKTPSVDQTSEVYERKTPSMNQPLEMSITPLVDQTSEVYERTSRSVYQTLKAYITTTPSVDQTTEVSERKTFESRQSTSAPLTKNASGYAGKSISTDIALLTTHDYTWESKVEQSETGLQTSNAPAKRTTTCALFFNCLITFILIHSYL